MNWETALQALEDLHDMGTRIVVFEGGEPFLWNDGVHTFHDLVHHAKERFLRVAVTTNGTFPLDIPVDVLWVSIDGLREHHNTLRSNSYDRMWSNLKESAHPNTIIHFTMNRENWHDIGELAKALQNVPTVRGITVQLFYPYGQGEDSLTLTPGARRAAIENVIHLKRQGYPIFNSENRLRAMINNSWTCHDDILVNVDPDGTITRGCYVKNRGNVNCRECGFTPVAEASGALDLVPGSVLAGWHIFINT